MDSGVGMSIFKRRLKKPVKPPSEEELLKEGICPDCGSDQWYEGPSGGMATNYYCCRCGEGWNIAWPFSPDRIGNITKNFPGSTISGRTPSNWFET